MCGILRLCTDACRPQHEHIHTPRQTHTAFFFFFFTAPQLYSCKAAVMVLRASRRGRNALAQVICVNWLMMTNKAAKAKCDSERSLSSWTCFSAISCRIIVIKCLHLSPVEKPLVS